MQQHDRATLKCICGPLPETAYPTNIYLGCNPILTHLGVDLTEFLRTYFQVILHQILMLIKCWCQSRTMAYIVRLWFSVEQTDIHHPSQKSALFRACQLSLLHHLGLSHNFVPPTISNTKCQSGNPPTHSHKHFYFKPQVNSFNSSSRCDELQFFRARKKLNHVKLVFAFGICQKKRAGDTQLCSPFHKVWCLKQPLSLSFRSFYLFWMQMQLFIHRE